jgi:hypothetical protein
MHIGEYLNKLAEEEQEKQALTALEQMFDHMSVEDVIKIATSDMKGKAPGDAPEANISTYSSGAMSAHKREALPAKSFAVPVTKAKKIGVVGEIKGEAKGKYPIPDIKHGKNALARVSQHGTPAERQAVRTKVYSKFPQLKAGFQERHGGASPISKENIKKVEQGGISKSAADKMTFVEQVARQLARTHHEVVKQATCMTKEDEFTTPEAKAKAQVMSRALKATKGAPTNIRRSAVKMTAQRLRTAG